MAAGVDVAEVVRAGLRRLVPDRVRSAEGMAFERVAAVESRALDVVLPRLSRAADHSLLWIAVAGVLAVAAGGPGRRAALRGLLAVLLTSALANQPGKRLTQRARPGLDLVPAVRQLASQPSSTSFPSGHAASAAAFATAVGAELPLARAPLGLLAAGVAASRIYTGVHHAGDVVAGALLGAGVAAATRLPDRR